ncbi:hypothetical protein [Azospirillum agricola]|uniref:hypothetical protein n=1 Tax=Azospirillum agricola TaxID=1720247 RepID=UPI000A0F33FB|nr:hypothetical protein [Azospirillum agricola]SMH61969.1 hypothetical protein SAMN02982994_6075 [Azospirillum lipoferum]
MRRVGFLHGIAGLLLTATAAGAVVDGEARAQDMGGIGFGPAGVSAANLAQAFAQPARQPVFASARRGTPAGAMVTNPGKSRKEFHQQLIAKTRGDAGFLAGFSQGQALAPSRNPPPSFEPSVTFIDAPFIVNNINSALNIAIGEGNSTDQGVVTGGEGVILDPGAGRAAPEAAAPVATAPVAAADPALPRPRNRQKGADGPRMPKLPEVPPVATQEMPKVPTLPGTAPSGQPDAMMTTLGPLPYLPFAMKNGGVQFNNANSAVNIASGTGNFAGQRVKSVQR